MSRIPVQQKVPKPQLALLWPPFLEQVALVRQVPYSPDDSWQTSPAFVDSLTPGTRTS